MPASLIVFRTDASREIGTGHLMRCLTLASALREAGATVEFVCREHAGHLCDLLEQRGFTVRRLPASDGVDGNEFGGFGGFGGGFSPSAAAPAKSAPPDRAAATGSTSGTGGSSGKPGEPAHAAWLGCDWTQDAAQTVAALGGRPDWLIIDHYALDDRWQRVLRAQAGRIMVIDDLADRQHDCDLLLDQNLVPEMASRYAKRVPNQCTCLLGPQYALLQPLYADLRAQRKQRQDPPRRIFAFFGGFDGGNLSGMAVEAFLALHAAHPDAGLQLDLVLSGNSPHAFAIQKLARQHANIHLYSQLPSLAPLMAVADLALGAGGATTWERLCLGLPALIVTVAQNQCESAGEQQAQGLVHVLGHAGQVSSATMLAALQRVLDEGVASLVPADLSAVVDGQGVQRVLDKLQQQLPQPLQEHLRQQALQQGNPQSIEQGANHVKPD